MKRILLLAVAALLIGSGLLASAQVQTESLTATEILNRVNAAWQGDSFHGIMSLDIVLGGQTKSHKLEVWTLGSELALIRVLEPEIDRNSGYLQTGDDLWYYAPGVGSIKLPAIAIGDALFGAGPSLEDLSHGTLSDDYDVSLVTASESVGKYFLTLTPHPNAPVVYGRLEISVSSDFVIETLIYYDQRGEVLQTATFSDVIRVAGRVFATTIVITDSYGDQTIERIESPQFDLALNAMFFSLDTFESWGDDS
ncbi:outer membrane lipoprotein-sorting protein [Candidatus Bipolaricaulota bacterium]|nr:outer membrane lipoprotein-sorting protein [Candidatus Bipolaricaulota bacterium]